MIAPALPAMARAFPAVPNADYLSRIALTITALAIAIAAPLAGALADRFGRKRILSLSLLVFTLAGASGLFLDDLYWIVASRFVLGMATAGIHTAVIALIGDHFTGAERARYMGLQHAVVSFSGVVLFSVAGAISEISWRTPFAFYLIGVILLPAALAWITEPRRVHPSNDPRHRRWRPGVSLSLVCGLGFLFVTGTHVIPIYLPFLVAEDGGPARLGGFGLALFMASSAAAASFYGRIKNGLGFSAVFRAGFGLLALGLAFVGVAEGLLLLSCGPRAGRRKLGYTGAEFAPLGDGTCRGTVPRQRSGDPDKLLLSWAVCLPVPDPAYRSERRGSPGDRRHRDVDGGCLDTVLRSATLQAA